MAVKKIEKFEMHATITVIAKIKKIDFVSQKFEGFESDMCKILLRWGTNSLFIYEKELNVIKKLQKLQVDDIVEINGIFAHNWFPGAKSTIPTITKILEFKKLGVQK